MDKLRFCQLWQRCCRAGGGQDAEEVYDAVHQHYSEAGRHYHTPAHVEHCLRQFDLARERLDNADAVEMAVWFHDIIYSTAVSSGDNERASAELFKSRAGESFEQAFTERVYRLIMVTTHSETPVDNDECFMVARLANETKDDVAVCFCLMVRWRTIFFRERILWERGREVVSVIVFLMNDEASLLFDSSSSSPNRTF